jgi:hypothetical protein
MSSAYTEPDLGKLKEGWREGDPIETQRKQEANASVSQRDIVNRLAVPFAVQFLVNLTTCSE